MRYLEYIFDNLYQYCWNIYCVHKNNDFLNNVDARMTCKVRIFALISGITILISEYANMRVQFDGGNKTRAVQLISQHFHARMRTALLAYLA